MKIKSKHVLDSHLSEMTRLSFITFSYKATKCKARRTMNIKSIPPLNRLERILYPPDISQQDSSRK